MWVRRRSLQVLVHDGFETRTPPWPGSGTLRSLSRVGVSRREFTHSGHERFVLLRRERQGILGGPRSGEIDGWRIPKIEPIPHDVVALPVAASHDGTAPSHRNRSGRATPLSVRSRARSALPGRRGHAVVDRCSHRFRDPPTPPRRRLATPRPTARRCRRGSLGTRPRAELVSPALQLPHAQPARSKARAATTVAS